MKRYFSVLLAAVLIVTLCSCNGASSNAGAGASPAGGETAEARNGIPRSITLADGSTYPNGTVTFIAPFAAGGGVDLGIRLFIKYAQEYTDAALIVENIEGGGGLVGIQTGLGRASDGHTIWHIDTGPQYVPTSLSQCPFDVLADMSLVGQLVADDRVWVMAKDETRFTNAEEFFAYAAEHPGEISVATSGATISGCSTIYLEQAAGVELNPIAFNGSADAKAAFLGRHCDIMAAGVSEAYPMLLEDQCIVICVMTDERIDIEGFEDAPTCKELGYDLISTSTDRGLAMSADTDPAIVQWWTDVMGAVTSDPAFLAEAESMSLIIKYRNSVDFTNLAAQQFDLWYDIKEGAGL